MAPGVVRLREAGLARALADAEMVGAAREVVEGVRAAELARRGLEDQEEARIGAEGLRRTAIGEIEVALGLGAREAGFLVTAAMAPSPVRGVVDEALRRGEVTWGLVRSFYERTATLERGQRVLVAEVLMGTDAGVAAAERLDPDGDLHGRPWSGPRYRTALEAEVTACRGTDGEAERAARVRAYEARSMRVRAHEDGTATMYLRGPVATVVAAGERLERAARSVHALGDPRTLDQLRVDLALGLLIYATIALGDGKPVNPAPSDNTFGTGDANDMDDAVAGADDGVGADDEACTDGHGDGHAGRCGKQTQDLTDEDDDSDDDSDDDERGQGVLFDDLLAPQDMELLVRAVNALPPVGLQVIVPWATLAGGFPVCAHCSGPLDATSPQAQHPDQRPPEDTGEDSAQARDGTADPPTGEAGEDCARAGDGAADPPTRGAGEDSALDGPGRGGPHGRPGARGRGGVAEVLGANPFFISDGQARELALMPGTTLHRLVVDPRDGRLVERTIKGYKPDADMRRQVIAADVYSRAPGARVGAYAGELDHVLPYGWAGGPTSEANLALLAKRVHQYKTDGAWRAQIGARRDLEFTTLLGQVVATRVHDYRTYVDQRAHEGTEDEERRDRAGQLFLAALADEARDTGSRGGGGGGGRGRRDWLTLDHTDPRTGRTRPGPHPDQPTIDDLLDQRHEGQADGDEPQADETPQPEGKSQADETPRDDE